MRKKRESRYVRLYECVEGEWPNSCGVMTHAGRGICKRSGRVKHVCWNCGGRIEYIGKDLRTNVRAEFGVCE